MSRGRKANNYISQTLAPRVWDAPVRSRSILQVEATSISTAGSGRNLLWTDFITLSSDQLHKHGTTVKWAAVSWPLVHSYRLITSKTKTWYFCLTGILTPCLQLFQWFGGIRQKPGMVSVSCIETWQEQETRKFAQRRVRVIPGQVIMGWKKRNPSQRSFCTTKGINMSVSLPQCSPCSQSSLSSALKTLFFPIIEIIYTHCRKLGIYNIKDAWNCR